MAWRIDEALMRGFIDNRVKGKVTGELWFLNRDKPVILDLHGNPWRDLAGYLVSFHHTKPKAVDMDRFAPMQNGDAGDITASRKVKVPELPVEEFYKKSKLGVDVPYHWANCLYLEWYSERNGRVVIESVDYTITLEDGPAWTMSEEEEYEQGEKNQQAAVHFMNQITEAVQPDAVLPEQEDPPTSKIEKKADEEAARMDLLMDRIMARLEREGLDDGQFEIIMEEERERLRRESGEPEPEPLSHWEKLERDAMIREMNEAAQEALEQEETLPERKEHPLVKTCHELGSRLFHDVRDHRWLPDHALQEHPLNEVVFGVQCAGAKLAGALNPHFEDDDEWPPDPLFAGDTLVRLKKARTCLNDALMGLNDVDEQQLALPEWRSQARVEIEAIQKNVQQLIADIRSTLD